jgi:pyruvate dehydrogenase E2 component (dihydrolipoamide acetyltransferase)
MAKFEFNMPDVGEGLAEVEVSEWTVAVGDWVEENQKIADLETDKSIVSMPAPATGRIVELAAEPGERVAVGALLLVMEVSDEGEEGAAEAPAESAEKAEADTAPPAAAAPAPAGKVVATPSARRLARQLGVDLAAVAGSGPRGRILPEDVRGHHESQSAGAADAAQAPRAATAPETEVAPGDADEEIPLRGVRRRMAETLTESYRSIPHVAGFHEFVIDRLVAERERLKPEAESRGVKLTYLAFVVKAVALALRDHRWLNASLDEERGVIVLKKSRDIGIAMASRDGLIVPVLKQADTRDLFGISGEIQRLADAAEAHELTPQEMRGGTFTISNVGPAGGNFGTSLIRPPEVAILGLGRAHDRAVVENGEVVVRPVLPVSLTFDHRVVDGEQALGFVGALREYLETSPGSLSSG